MNQLIEQNDLDVPHAIVAKQANHSQFIGSIPQIYDEHLGPLLFEFSAADITSRLAAVCPNAKDILEVACGTGISTRHLSQKFGGDTRIIATDLNKAMLSYAQNQQPGLGNVTLAQADAQDLEFSDSSFDAILCQFGVMFFPDKEAAFKEFARVLRPGGILAYNVWGSLADNPVVQIAQNTIASFFNSDPPDFLEVPFGFSDIDANCALIRQAGLSGLGIEEVNATIERPDVLTIARGFVEGNPGILQIRQQAVADVEDITAAVAHAIHTEYGTTSLQVPLTETVFLAHK